MLSNSRAEPISSPSDLTTRARWVTLLAVLGALFIRKTDSFLNPQFWAEDFWPFFEDAYIYGPKLILNPYNGYLHFWPRVIASLSAPFHPQIQPTLYLIGSVLVTLWVAGQALSSRLALPAKPLLALALVLVPHTGEVFLNPTNLQWITGLGIVLIGLMRDPRSFGEWAADLVFLLFAGLSGPFSVLLWPFFLVRAYLRRTAAAYIVAGWLGVLAGIQGWFLLHAAPTGTAEAWHFPRLWGVLAVRLPMTLAVGEKWAIKPSYGWIVALGLLLVLALVGASLRKGQWRQERLALLAILIAMGVASVLRARLDTWDLTDTVNGDRYLYGPKVVMAWLAVIAIAGLQTKVAQRCAIGLAALAFAANLPAFRIAPLPDLHWETYSEKIAAGEKVEVKINPGWQLVFPGRPPH